VHVFGRRERVDVQGIVPVKMQTYENVLDIGHRGYLFESGEKGSDRGPSTTPRIWGNAFFFVVSVKVEVKVNDGRRIAIVPIYRCQIFANTLVHPTSVNGRECPLLVQPV
jgi:hypothetical protein